MININFLHNYPPFARLLKEIKRPKQSKKKSRNDKKSQQQQ